MINLKTAIRSINLFSHLDDSVIEKISSISNISNHKKDSILFYESDSTDKLLFLVEGLLKVYKLDKYENEIFLYYIYPTSMISELSNLDENKIHCFSNSMFLKDTILLSIDYKKFKEEFLSKNELISKFINEMVLKNQQLQCIVNKELVFDSTSKVAYMLANDLDMFNMLKRGEVANLLHIQPETLSRVLKKLVRNEIISIEKGNISIEKTEQLKNIYSGI